MYKAYENDFHDFHLVVHGCHIDGQDCRGGAIRILGPTRSKYRFINCDIKGSARTDWCIDVKDQSGEWAEFSQQAAEEMAKDISLKCLEIYAPFEIYFHDHRIRDEVDMRRARSFPRISASIDFRSYHIYMFETGDLLALCWKKMHASIGLSTNFCLTPLQMGNHMLVDATAVMSAEVDLNDPEAFDKLGEMIRTKNAWRGEDYYPIIHIRGYTSEWFNG